MSAEVISLQDFREKRELESHKFQNSLQELEELMIRLFGPLLDSDEPKSAVPDRRGDSPV